ncbi:PDZ domain-containing protein [Sphingobacterium sp. SRCM116780]|uniref:PDZ domain-containing protein n=1 Tax=Sphingobacterium sp. SRCM116780 TaxID=2907623 RepID=UPI001F192672|nr:PDZ domain-containing protein [Sphingobacterium sp. SRCM116780]UIR56531.1 PDZ domain-containing protein [Sphingobacterium sp. SRCM116780]
MKIRFLLIISLFFQLAFGQSAFVLKKNKKLSIPFTFVHNLVIIPVEVNGFMMNFLLDTGVKETMVFGKSLGDIDSSIFKNKLQGLGRNEGIDAVLAVNNRLLIAKKMEDKDHPIFILDNEHIDISSRIGVEINGILGSRFFADYRIEFDFLKKRIIVFPHGETPKSWSKMTILPLDIKGNRPYIDIAIQQDESQIHGKALIDMGNSDAVLLLLQRIEGYQVRFPFITDYIGQGLNGEIYGLRNRIKQLTLGPFTMSFPLVAYPESESVQNAKIINERIGSIGNELLRRFKIVFDYPNSQIYLKKNREFDKFYYLNMSGLELIHDGVEWEKQEVPVTLKNDGSKEISFDNKVQFKFVLKPLFKIDIVRPSSPAQLAGLMVDDKILAINGRRASSYSLEEINNLMKSEEGKEIRMKIERNGQTKEVRFILKDPLPFDHE